MNIFKKDLKNCIFDEINYHDGRIVSTSENNNNFTITFMDGLVPNQINEITFVNCKAKYDYKLEKREIYQLDDITHFEGSKWNMTLLVWMKNNNLLEKVWFEAEDIVIKVSLDGKEETGDLNNIFNIK